MMNYMRSETKGNGLGSPSRNNQSAPQHPQQPPPPLASRQHLAEAAKVQIPRPSRFNSASQPPASMPASSPPSQSQPQPLATRHTRANSDAGRANAPSEQDQQIWEDSTINSLLGESVSGSTRPRPPHSQDIRRLDSLPSQRQRYRDRNAADQEELNPFVIQENGLLKVLPASGGNNSIAKTNPRSVLDNFSLDDPYAAKSRYDSSPQKPGHTLKHAKYPFRDARAAKRASMSDNFSQNATAGDTVNLSPERFLNGVQTREPRPENRTQDYETHRSTIFHDIDTPGRTPAPPEDDEISEAPSQGDEATNRTPRQSKIAPPQSSQPPLPLPLTKMALQESTLPRMSNYRDKKPDKMGRKRRLSLDYDDHALSSMSYADLRNESFDHDPARMAIQPANVPSGDSLEDKLAYFKGKDENSQHHFFTQITVKEWDHCGDWFLEQFSSVVQRMKDSRQAKRQLVEQFESEIASREEMVRGKVESIDRTLKDLKQEGEGMMRGKDVDV